MGNTLSINDSKGLNWGLTILRVGVGVLFFIFGWQKLSGGAELWTMIGGSMNFLGISFAPTFWGLMASIAEFAGGLLLAIGLFTRWASLSLVLTMIVAVILKANTGSGLADVSSPLMALLITLSFTLNGATNWSVDNYLAQKKQSGALA
ncbi:DoxX family protein [Chitinophaga deserti]|uniref:DoxX family protein n=1 Tax=Chitinophaga deserti TaxID=2164099 RepID=UPI000D6DA0B0|nr:DoxX family protein [Chitinophaga deserti]